MNDEQFLLASAYLDGELTAAERIAAETDPDIASEIDRLAALRTAVRDVVAPAPRVREAAIAAAMKGFTAAPARRAPAGGTFTFRRRPWSVRYLGFAAAAVAVGALGVVVTNALNSDAGEGEITESAAVDEPADDGLALQAAPAIAEAAPAAEAERAAESPAAESATADAMAAPAAEAPVALEQPFGTPAELASFAGSLIEREAAGALPPTPNTRCPQPRILAEVEYLVDGRAMLLLVAVDTEVGVVLGIDPTTCDAVIEGPLS